MADLLEKILQYAGPKGTLVLRGELPPSERRYRIVSVDGVPIEECERLDWRSDDAYLTDAPVRRLDCEEDDEIQLEIERSWGEMTDLSVTASMYSAFEAAKASARIIENEQLRIGYIHFWFIHVRGVPQLLKEKLEGDFADCDALILDLRGRGGNGGVLKQIYAVLSGENSSWQKPVVALINQNSRSAKEVIAYELKKQNLALLVGERTAGAVIPATFKKVGPETMLMYPTFRLGKYTDTLEGHGVAPDIVVREPGPYSAGADPLIDAGVEAAGQWVRMIQ